MKWIESLLDHFPEELLALRTEIISNLQHKELEIVEISVTLIAKYLNKIDDYSMLGEILEFMEKSVNSSLDQAKIMSVLKILFIYIDGEKILEYFCSKLEENSNKKFK